MKHQFIDIEQEGGDFVSYLLGRVIVTVVKSNQLVVFYCVAHIKLGGANHHRFRSYSEKLAFECIPEVFSGEFLTEDFVK